MAIAGWDILLDLTSCGMKFRLAVFHRMTQKTEVFAHTICRMGNHQLDGISRMVFYPLYFTADFANAL